MYAERSERRRRVVDVVAIDVEIRCAGNDAEDLHEPPGRRRDPRAERWIIGANTEHRADLEIQEVLEIYRDRCAELNALRPGGRGLVDVERCHVRVRRMCG